MRVSQSCGYDLRMCNNDDWCGHIAYLLRQYRGRTYFPPEVWLMTDLTLVSGAGSEQGLSVVPQQFNWKCKEKY